MSFHIALLVLTCAARTLLAQNPYFWHITDLHYDPHYNNWAQYLWNSCNENVSQSQGNLGDYECDSPWELVKSSVLAMKNHGPDDPAFILWTGDNAPHPKNYSWLDKEMVVEISQNITALIQEAYPGVPVLVALGNHDYSPVNQLPGESNYIYTALHDLWHPQWLNSSEIEETFTKGAYYSTMLSNTPRVRAVITNTNLYYTRNDAVEGQDDPGGQFLWLENILQQARVDQEKVYLVQHIPSGVMEVDPTARFFKEEYNTRFNDIVRKNGDVLLGIYSCHQHFDTFRLFYDDNGKATAAMYIAPSVTPWRARLGDEKGEAHNPAVRKIIFDPVSYELLNIEQLYLDLNKYKDDDFDTTGWAKLYTFTEKYGVKNVSVSELHSLAEEFKEFGNEKFHLYYEMNTVATDHPSIGPCDCVCKNEHVCSILNVDYDEYDQCLVDMGATCGSWQVVSDMYILSSIVSLAFLGIVWEKLVL